MRDAMEARIWAEYHQQFSDMIGETVENLWRGFKAGQQKLWEAPWRPKPKTAKRDCAAC